MLKTTVTLTKERFLSEVAAQHLRLPRVILLSISIEWPGSQRPTISHDATMRGRFEPLAPLRAVDINGFSWDVSPSGSSCLTGRLGRAAPAPRDAVDRLFHFGGLVGWVDTADQGLDSEPNSE